MVNLIKTLTKTPKVDGWILTLLALRMLHSFSRNKMFVYMGMTTLDSFQLASSLSS